jgi:hypothetical protein
MSSSAVAEVSAFLCISTYAIPFAQRACALFAAIGDNRPPKSRVLFVSGGGLMSSGNNLIEEIHIPIILNSSN